MSPLIDTSFLLALIFTRDSNHQKAQSALPKIRGVPIISIAVLPELFFMVADRRSYHDAIRALRMVRDSRFQIEQILSEDLKRMDEIMEKYSDNKFDFADTAIMALSERMKLTQVYTFDHRDFGVYRPLHTDYLEILP
jgi:predicted nucleic acid-binding protein